MHKISQHAPKRASDLGHVPEQQSFRSPHTKVAPAGVLRFQSLPHVEALSLCLPEFVGLESLSLLDDCIDPFDRKAVAALVDGSGPVQFESVSAARRGLSRTDGFDGWVPPPPVLKVWVVASRYPVVFDVRSGRDIGRSAVQRI